MALVTTSIVSGYDYANWNVLEGGFQPEDSIPRAEILFTGTDTIPAKILTNESLWTLTCNLPRNFVYRCVEMRLWCTADTTGDLDDFQESMFGLITPDPAPAWSFLVTAESAAFEYRDAATKDVLRYYKNASSIEAPIIAEDDSSIYMTWFDNSTDATASVVTNWRIRVLQYDIQQYHHYPVHHPIPTISV